MQTTPYLLMIRPVQFGFNAQTAVNNAFQVPGKADGAQEKAIAEFDAFVAILRQHSVDVMVIEDTPEPHTPDSIFPNNWISFHADGSIVLYPMYARNRRLERKSGIVQAIARRFSISRTIDLTPYEQEAAYLEGTGSMVLDRPNKIAYACLSPRTDYLVLEDFCAETGYTAVAFDAVDQQGQPIYHTNVMMCVADKYAVVCMDAIAAEHEKKMVEDALDKSEKELITISLDQMNQFAGNMLQVSNIDGEPLLVMSSRAYGSLNPGQVSRLSAYNAIIHAPLTTIETNGGGSARCMMAEIHLPLNN